MTGSDPAPIDAPRTARGRSGTRASSASAVAAAGQRVAGARRADGPQGGPQTYDQVRAALHLSQAHGNLAVHALEDGHTLDDLIDHALDAVRETLDVEFSSFFDVLVPHTHLFLRAGRGWESGVVGETGVDVGVGSGEGAATQTGYTLVAPSPVAVEDFDSERRLAPCSLLRSHGVKSGVTVQVALPPSGGRSGRLLGVLGAHSRTPRHFTEQECWWLADVARILARAVFRLTASNKGTKQAQEVARRAQNAEEEALYLKNNMAAIAAAPTTAGRLAEAANLAVANLSDWAFVDLVDEDGLSGFTEGDRIRRLVVRFAEDTAENRRLAAGLVRSYPRDHRVPYGTPHVLRERAPQLIRHVDDAVLERAATSPEHLAALKAANIRSYAGVPIWVGGRVAGSLGLVTVGENTLEEADLARAQGIADCAALALAGGLPDLASDGTSRELGRVAAATPPDARPTPPQSAESPEQIARRLGITRRQHEIVRLLASHKNVPEVASELNIAVGTVENHVYHLRKIFNVSSYRQAAAKALELGLVD